MKRHGHLFEQIISKENLSFAFDRAAKGKTRRRIIRKAKARKEQLVEALHCALRDGTYRVSPYATRIIREPKQRIIHILPFYPDRIVQHAIMAVLEPVWDSYMVPQSFSCRVGMGQHKASALAKRYVRQYRYVLQCDISKFYHSLDHHYLMAVIERTIKDPRLLALLREIVMSYPDPRGCPIGSLLSQWFGNLYLTGLDRMVLRNKLASGYVRYCDDFLLFSNDKQALWTAGLCVTKWCGDAHLGLSKMILRRTTQGIDFLGYRHFPDGYILLRKRTVVRIKRRVTRIWRALTDGRIKSLDHVQGQLASAWGWMKHADCHHLITSLHLSELRGIIKNLKILETRDERLSVSA